MVFLTALYSILAPMVIVIGIAYAIWFVINLISEYRNIDPFGFFSNPRR